MFAREKVTSKSESKGLEGPREGNWPYLVQGAEADKQAGLGISIGPKGAPPTIGQPRFGEIWGVQRKKERILLGRM